MHEINIEQIRKYLQNKEVQERVSQSMLEARSKATVTISKAAGLFGFSESQLREWEKRGLLKSKRTELPEDSKAAKGHRQFSPDELDKLALIRELMDRGYTISDIPQDVDEIWEQVREGNNGQIHVDGNHEIKYIPKSERVPVDKRVEIADEEHFWRFFVSQTLRFTLLLICEEMPGTIAGIFLPVENKDSGLSIVSPHDISEIGPAMVGWLGANQAFYAFFESYLGFDYPSDFRIEHLRGWDENICPAPTIVIQRKARSLVVTENQVAAIQRIVHLVYKHINDWLPFFGSGKRDWIEHVTNFGLNPNVTDALLERMMNVIVELGGEEHDSDRWKFCNLFLPEDPSLPIQQRIIRVRSHSTYSPAMLNSMVLTVARPGLTYRAYQSGQVIYRHHITPRDSLVAYTDIEASTRSAIAIPLGGADGMVAGAIYIASEQPDAFSPADLSALRLMTKMLEELLATYQTRLYVVESLSEVITKPKIVDNASREFLSEEDFIDDFEQLLNNILEQDDKTELQGKEISFIVLDIDKQTSLAITYGDHAARNLNHEVGVKLQRQLQLQSNFEFRQVYHIGADCFYLKLPGMSLEDARSLAEQLRKLLRGNYRVNARRAMAGRPVLADELLLLPDVTVRLGVANYKYPKLKEVLERYEIGDAIAETRTLILNNLIQTLNIGKSYDGDCVVSWDYDTWGYKRL